MKKDPKELLNIIAQVIFDKKGFNIMALDVLDVSTITDYIIVAEANVDRHAIAIAKTIIDVLAENGVSASYTEGLQNGDWVVLDYMQIMIHIFMPGLRERYQLERLWSTGKIIDLEIEVSHSSTGSMG